MCRLDLCLRRYSILCCPQFAPNSWSSENTIHKMLSWSEFLSTLKVGGLLQRYILRHNWMQPYCGKGNPLEPFPVFCNKITKDENMFLLFNCPLSNLTGYWRFWDQTWPKYSNKWRRKINNFTIVILLPINLLTLVRNSHLLHNEGCPCTETPKNQSLLKITAIKNKNCQGLPPTFSQTIFRVKMVVWQ